MAFKTPLFRRYPSTVVYLFEADNVWTPPGAADVLDDAHRVDHVFTGTIGADITFFGFPIDPVKLSGYWVVLGGAAVRIPVLRPERRPGRRLVRGQLRLQPLRPARPRPDRAPAVMMVEL